jgi:hypothetical protein
MSGNWAKKSKEVASTKRNSGACKGKGPATSKIDDDDDDNFMPTTKANKVASTKGKRVAKPYLSTKLPDNVGTYEGSSKRSTLPLCWQKAHKAPKSR